MKPNAIRLAKEVLSSRRKRADGGTDEWQSTGKLVNDDKSVNWGDPESASDFFRADKEDLRRRKDAEAESRLDRADTTASIPPARTAEGRQMAEARVVLTKPEKPAAEAPAPIVAAAPATTPAPTPAPTQIRAGSLNEDSEYQEPLNDQQRQALALEQWKAAGRSGTPDNPNPAPAPIVQASLTTPAQTATDANRQPLRFAPMPSSQSPEQTKAEQIWQRMLVQESGNRQFDRNGRLIVSPAGAIGMTQVMPRTGPEAARLAGLPWSLERLKTDPEYNYALGRAYYDAQLKRFNDPVLAAAAYNGGPGRVAQALRASERTGRPFTDFVKPETRNYVQIVSAAPRRAPLRFGPAEGYEEGGRVGYADKGAVDEESVDVGYTDPMGNVAYSDNKDNRDAPGYKTVEKASDLAGRFGATVGEPMRKAAENYIGNVGKAWHESGEYAKEGLKNTTSDKGPLYNASGPLQYGLGSIGQIFSPLTGAAMSAGDAATQLSGNPEIGKRVELIGGLVDPSHAGALKNAARAAHEVSPAMFIPVAAADPALATAKKMLSEGKSKAEIWRETGIHPGPESHFGSYELESNVPDQYGRYQRVGTMPEEPEPRWFKEISDEGLKLNRTPEADTPIFKDLPNVPYKNEAYSFEHPELQAQFPEFEQLHKSVDVNPFHQTSGFYSSSGEYAPGQYGRHLQITTDTPENARQVAAHELQHFVADVGGLEQGNNPNNPVLQDFYHHIRQQSKETYNSVDQDFRKFVEDGYKDALKEFNIAPDSPKAPELRAKVQEEARKIYREMEPEKVQALEKAQYVLERIHDPYDLYQHMYGEALARATEERLKMTAGERRYNPPEFNYHNYNDTMIPYTPIPENQLYSEKDLMDFKLNANDKNSALNLNPSLKMMDPEDRAANLAKFMSRSAIKNSQTNDPIRLYHATTQPNLEALKAGGFDPTLSGEATWLSPYPDKQPAYHNTGGGKNYREGANVMPVYADIQTPLVLDTPEMIDWAKTVFANGSNEFPQIMRPEWRKALIDEGYDGIIYGGPKSKEYALHGLEIGQQPHRDEEILAFFPERQLKSATGNKGDFDMGKHRLSESSGGTVDRAMNISRFGTDAVQTAVNLARQHRGRPENS